MVGVITLEDVRAYMNQLTGKGETPTGMAVPASPGEMDKQPPLLRKLYAAWHAYIAPANRHLDPLEEATLIQHSTSRFRGILVVGGVDKKGWLQAGCGSAVIATEFMHVLDAIKWLRDWSTNTGVVREGILREDAATCWE